MQRNRIRLTESQLHRVIKESVKRVLREGQGWNAFKYLAPDAYRDGKKGISHYMDDTVKDYIENGRFDDSTPYYDKDGVPTDKAFDYRQPNGRNGRINTGLSGRLGRAAGITGVRAANALGRGVHAIGNKINQWHNKDKNNNNPNNDDDYAPFRP